MDEAPAAPDADPLIEVVELPLLPAPEVQTLPRFERPLQVSVREARLLEQPPWVRTLGKLAMEVSTQGWRFPAPLEPAAPREPAPPQLDLSDEDAASEGRKGHESQTG